MQLPNMYKSRVQLLLTLSLIAAAAGAVFEPYIIGGVEVDIAKHPYLVSIRYRLTADGAYWHKCAGAIYTERVVITAAQCIREIGANTERVLVVAGANLRTGVDGLPYPASKWFAHENYSSTTVDYDIGLLIVDVPFDFAQLGVGSIQIAGKRPLVGRMGVIAGWGYREEFGPSAYSLEEASVPFVSQSDCLAIYGVTEVTDRMICAGYVYSGEKDACQGDTGGPLVYGNELVGLVSWGRGCARPGYPTVYTYVPSLKKWVDDTIAGNI